LRDPRFRVMHQGEELSLIARSSDGQLLFLANLAAKMNHKTPLGSRPASSHRPLRPFRPFPRSLQIRLNLSTPADPAAVSLACRGVSACP
jgi:hypothetical protein